MLPHFPYKRVLFVKAALEYPLGRQVWQRCRLAETISLRVPGSPASRAKPTGVLFSGKQTLVVFAGTWSLLPASRRPISITAGGGCRECANTATQMGKKALYQAVCNIEILDRRRVL